MIYRLRFAFHLWRNVPGMTVWAALRYPTNRADNTDPIEERRQRCLTWAKLDRAQH